MRSSILILAGTLALLGSTRSMGQMGGTFGSYEADTDVLFTYSPQGSWPDDAPVLEITINGWTAYIDMIPDRFDDNVKSYHYTWHIPPGTTGETVRWQMNSLTDNFPVH